MGDPTQSSSDVISPSAELVREVQAHSTEFRRELGVTDLVLTQILYVVGSGWVGTAALLGPSHIWYWLGAILLFYLPQAAVVIYLNRLMPLEGGIYQWAKAGLGEFWGFLTAWNLWVYTVLIMATFGVMVAQNLIYLLGEAGKALTELPHYTTVVSVTAIIAVTIVSVFGLRVSKWFQNAGGAAQFCTYTALISLPFLWWWNGLLPEYYPLDAPAPGIDFEETQRLGYFGAPIGLMSFFDDGLKRFNIFGKMALGALSGFEFVAILAGESRRPARSIARSVIIAAPIIALMFIFGTSSVLALVPREIDLVSPIPQTLRHGFKVLRVEVVAEVIISLFLVRQVGNMMLTFTGNTRLPMVAGWDGLLPNWFTQLHPRYRTPINSILFVGALTLVLTLIGQAGVGVQEAFQQLENAAGIFYGFTYLALFAIPLVAVNRLKPRPPLWLRGACVAGLAMTVLYCALSIFPIIEVKNTVEFTLKVSVALEAGLLLGLVLYVRGRRRVQV